MNVTIVEVKNAAYMFIGSGMVAIARKVGEDMYIFIGGEEHIIRQVDTTPSAWLEQAYEQYE